MFNTKNVLGTTRGARGFCAFLPHRTLQLALVSEAAIAQLGERETEDLKVPSSILGLGSCDATLRCHAASSNFFCRAGAGGGDGRLIVPEFSAAPLKADIKFATYKDLHLARIELATFSVLG